MLIGRKREVILSATIEYNYTLRNKGYSIGGHFKENNMNIDIDIKELETDVKRIIVEKLPYEMINIFGIEIKTRIITTRYGSLSIFFGVIITGIGIIAGYKDFYDSIQLLKKQCKSLLSNLLVHRFSNELEVDVSVDYPSLPEPSSGRIFRRLRKSLDLMPEELEELFAYNAVQNTGKGRRDGFFWYLLFMNVALIGLVAVLVGRAVLKVYFP